MKQFYYEQYDGEEKIEDATDKVYEMVVKMREAAEEIDREMVDRWVRDLVLYKTYTELGRTEEAVLKKLSEEYGRPYELGTGGRIGRDRRLSRRPTRLGQADHLRTEAAPPGRHPSPDRVL